MISILIWYLIGTSRPNYCNLCQLIKTFKFRFIGSTHLKHRVKTFWESIEIGTGFTEPDTRHSPLAELAPEHLCTQQGENTKEKEEKDKKRNYSLDRVDKRPE